MDRRKWLKNVGKFTATAAAGSALFLGKKAFDNHDIIATDATKTESEVLSSILANADISKIKTDFKRCINCEHCMPCDFGIDIPSVFIFMTNALKDDLIPEANENGVLSKSDIRRFLSLYDNNVDKKAQASRCISCYRCAGKCPQNIFIARQMDAIATYTEALNDLIAF